MTKDERLSVIEYSPVYGSTRRWSIARVHTRLLAKRTEAAAQQANAGEGGSWADVILAVGLRRVARQERGAGSRVWGEMIGKELQRSLSRTIASTIKSIIVVRSRVDGGSVIDRVKAGSLR